MKKFISLIIALQMICASGVTSYAEGDIVIRIEAEKYSSATVKGSVYDDDGLSGGKAVGFNWASPKDEEYIYEIFEVGGSDCRGLQSYFMSGEASWRLYSRGGGHEEPFRR